MAGTIVGRSRARRARAVGSLSAPAAVAFPIAGVGTIAAITSDGVPLLARAGAEAVAATALSHLGVDLLRAACAEKSSVLVVAIEGDQARPVIIGIIGRPTPAAAAPYLAKVDGRRVELTGQDEVALTCGKASIVLTKAGKVLITGTYLLSESKGTHRIRGTSVQIN